jgi:predicted house-cleaning NTP pyrophosphatase (Maf/HAM1 superfamily)
MCGKTPSKQAKNSQKRHLEALEGAKIALKTASILAKDAKMWLIEQVREAKLRAKSQELYQNW